MYRQKFILLFFFLGLLFVLAACRTNSAQTGKPNIILILTDDQPFHSIQYMPVVQRELVQKGVNFTNANVTTALCCPSRVSIFTGLYVRHHGVLTNRYPSGGAALFDDKSTLPVWLKQAGYRTALIGKYLNEYNNLPEGYIPPGWDDWAASYTTVQGNYYYSGYTLNENGSIHSYSTSEEDFSTDVFSNKAVNFIHDHADEPFFLSLNFVAPHQPYYSARRHTDLFKEYDDIFLPYRPLNWFERNTKDKPAWVRKIEQPDPERVDDIYQRQLRALMSVDESVQAVVDALEYEGIRGNTMIIFMSDNGYSLGNHGFVGKACPYDECLRIPLVVSYPDVIPAAREDDRFVLNVDIAPTIMDLVGMPDVAQYDGRSFMPLLKSGAVDWRDGFFFEQFQDDQDEAGGLTALIPPFTGFRTSEWSYIQYATGERELYDLINDPFEMQNLANRPENEMIMLELSARIAEIAP